ncbi:hypothetical protein [Streptomyces sp. WAC05374]|uniref:hypothetical protein n=1 Tax=Streptomyces sp. WAC05374 TaxID=2487420 RepID=UPI00135AFD0E|nr:hypothetical protein [Streptomyces sp. WAC05374]
MTFNIRIRTRHDARVGGTYGAFTYWRCSCGAEGRTSSGEGSAKRLADSHMRKYR